MEIHEQPTQYFEPQLATEPVLRIPVPPEPPEDIYLPAPRQRWFSKRPSFSKLLSSFTITLFVLFGAGLFLGGAWLYQSDMMLPGVTVMGLDLSQQSKAEATATLQTHWDAQTVTLVDGLESWSVQPADLGVTFDAAATAEVAYQQGRSWQSWQRFFQYEGQFPIQPVWQLDPNGAELFLQQQAAARYLPPVDATIDISNGRVQTKPAIDGREVDIEATKSWLLANAASVVMNGRLPLITQPVTAAMTDVSATAAQAEHLLTTSISIKAYDPINDFEVTWVVSPAIWGEWLLLEMDAADPTQFSWTLDQEKGTQFLQERLAALGEGRYVNIDGTLTAVTQAIQNGEGDISLRVFHQESSYQVQSGDTLASIGRQVGFPYPWLQQANPLVGEALSAGQNISVPSPDVLLPLPIVDNKRIVVSMSEQRVWVYENGELKWDWLASTGITSSPTAPGVFQIQAHFENAYAANWDLHMPNFMSVYQPVPGVEFFNGFHGFPTRDGVNLLWTQNLGAPVTYGCILLSNENIALLYEWAEPGVIVEIRP